MTNRRRSSRRLWAGAALLAALALGTFGAAGARADTEASEALTEKAIFFAADGMRPDLVERYADAGAMDTMEDLLDDGVQRPERPQAGVPAEHRRRLVHARDGHLAGRARLDQQHLPPQSARPTSTTAPRSRPPASCRPTRSCRPPSAPGRRSSRWSGSGARNLVPALQGPVVDFRTFFSDRGVLLNYDLPGQPAGANAFGVAYQRVDLDPATRLDERADARTARPRQEQLKVTNTAFPAGDNVDRFYDLYIYDSTNDRRTNYDRVLVVPSTAGKNGSAAAAARPGAGRLGGHQGDADRRPCRPDRRLLPQGDRDRAATCRSSASTTRRSRA